MSLEAIMEMERYVSKRDQLITLAEIKMKCEAFVQKRDKVNYKYSNEKWVDVDRQSYAIRDGEKIERVKCQ